MTAKRADHTKRPASEEMRRRIVSRIRRNQRRRERGRSTPQEGDVSGAEQDACHALGGKIGSPGLVAEALERAGEPAETLMATPASDPWIRSSDKRSSTCWRRRIKTRSACATGIVAVRPDGTAGGIGLGSDVHRDRALVRCRANLLRSDRAGTPLEIVDAFNLGTAQWGASGTPKEMSFRQVPALSLDTADEGANFHQCMAISHWVLGDSENASTRVRVSRDAVGTRLGTREFGCWRYERVAPKEFLKDLDEFQALIEGDETKRPRFMTRAASPSSD